MSYKLFLDDIRFPPDYDEDWVIARSMSDAIWYVEARGVPDWVAFDHDLAEDHYTIGLKHERTGYDFAKWLCDYISYNDVDLPENFGYSVHSMNPVGAANIKHYMHNFLVHWRKTREKDNDGH